MRAIVFDAGPVLREDYPEPRPADGEALVAVRLAGVCSTDLEVLKGYMGFTGVMGHEFVGEVLSGPAEWVGKRVAGEINCPCGTCAACRAGRGNHCPNRTVVGIVGRDGCFAERIALPAANLHAIPDNVPDTAAVFVEPLAAAFQFTRQVPLRSSMRVVALGDGRLGQLCARVAALHSEDVTLVGRHEVKLALARDTGLTAVAVDEYEPTSDADVVVEATGNPAGLQLAMQAVRPLGTIVLKSTTAVGAEMSLAPLVVDEVTVVGSRCGPFAAAIAALADGSVRVDDLASRTLGLSAGPEEIFDAARDGQNVKVLIDARR
ncbi:MAG: MDR/zinc-dependent alcohol dehydrogenase-like family protein [Phycisphaerae bacterium]